MKLSMTRAEREAFLADVHVGVLAIPEAGRGPLSAPIWYGYEPGGEIWVVTGRDSRTSRAPSSRSRPARATPKSGSSRTVTWAARPATPT